MSPGTATPNDSTRSRLLPTVRLGPVSFVLRPRPLAVVALLLILLFSAIVWHLAISGDPLPLADVARTLTGDPPSRRIDLIVTEFRAPRTLGALATGLSLGLAGALTQTVTRNPLASPDLLGIMSGASLGAVLPLVLLSTTGGAGGATGALTRLSIPLGAALFGGAAAALILLLTRGRGFAPIRIVIVGLGINGLCAALTTWTLTLGNVNTAGQALTWMAGSVHQVNWESLRIPLVAMVALSLVVIPASRALRVAPFDDLTAISLGTSPERIRLLLVALAAGLAIAATVLTGPISFVALASPQVARLLCRSAAPPPLAAALTGAILVLVADNVSANLLPVPLPAGVATAIIGAPYLIFLLLSRRSAL